MSARTIRCILMVSAFAAILSAARPSEAGPFWDWLTGRQPVYYPVGAPVPVGTPAVGAVPGAVAAAPLPATCSPAGTCPPAVTVPGALPAAPRVIPAAPGVIPAAPMNTVGYAPTAYPSAQAQYAAPAQYGAGVAPVTAYLPVMPYQGASNVSSSARYFSPYYVPPYVSAPAYQSAPVQVPVTAYRPVTSVDPISGQTRTTLQPCTTYEWQTNRIPYNSYRPTRGLFGRTYYDVPPQQFSAYSPVATPPVTAAPVVAAPVVAAPAYGSPAVMGSTIGSAPVMAPPSIPSYSPPTYGGSTYGGSTYSAPPASPGFSGASPLDAGSGAACPPDAPAIRSEGGSYSSGAEIGSGILSPVPSDGYRSNGGSSADEKPSLKGVPQTPPSPSVSLKGPTDDGYFRRDAGSNGSGNNVSDSREASPATSTQDQRGSGSSWLFPWQFTPAAPGGNSIKSEGTPPRGQVKPIPDPDKPGQEPKMITPPRLLDPGDRTVMRAGFASQIVPTSYVDEATNRRSAEKRTVIEARVAEPSTPPAKTPSVAPARRVLGDDGWSSNAREVR